MKYLISTENSLCVHLSTLLIEEIERFDIRSEVKYATSSNREVLRAIQEFIPDLLIIFGSIKANSLISLGKRLSVKTCFFYQSVLNKTTCKRVVSSADKIYSDLPFKKDQFDWEYSGSLLYEYIRKQVHVDYDQSLIHPLISVLTADEREMRDVKKLVRKLQACYSQVVFKMVNIFTDPRKAIKIVLNSNLIIGIGQLSSMIAVFTNCPIINVFGKKFFFGKIGVDQLVIHNLISKEVIPSYPISQSGLIAEEIDKILQDHQYCAGIMSNYQELKSTIGMLPVSCQIARKIVDWIE